MLVNKGEMLFYGIDNISQKLDVIIKSLNLKKQYFEIKLVMIEAVTNAFIHGNNSDRNKPISVRWKLKEKLLNVSVTDCGFGFKNLINYKEISKENILKDCGRGLYIISYYTDEMKFKDNSIIMKKNLL